MVWLEKEWTGKLKQVEPRTIKSFTSEFKHEENLKLRLNLLILTQ